MPPRSRKVAAAKTPSPMGRRSTRRTPTAIRTDPPAAEEAISADDVKLESPAAKDSPVVAALVEEDKEPEVDAKEEIAVEKVEEETSERGNEPLEVAEEGDVQEASGEGEGKETDAEDDKMEIEGKENDAEENKMKVDSNETSAAENKVEVEEGDKQLVEGETGVGEVEHICGSVADNDGNVESSVGVSDNNVTGDGEADDGEDEEEVDDEADDGEDEEEVDDEADDGENEEQVDDEANDGENEEADDEDNENEEDDEENEEDDPSLYMQAPLTERKRQKHFEIFVGGLDKGAVEEDVIEVFGTLGEIQSVRIVRHPVTQKSKGFAFVQYASMEHAKKALTEFKDGTEVKCKQVRISASDDDTLYLGNICKTWTKDNVIETLKGYGIEQIEDILLPENPKHEGRIRGFAFLEFTSHTDAMTAFQRLRKPDAVFGRDVSAKVSFAQTPLHPIEESLLQVKTVHLEGIPRSWDEGKVGELCKQHGEIKKIQLSRNFASIKKKDFGFVEFSSRDAAIACVEGINNAELREGDISVRAYLAKPTYKGHLARPSARGGYKINMDGETAKEVSQPKKNKKAKSKVTRDNGETQPKLKSSNGSKPSKPQRNASNGGKGKSSQSSKDKKRGRQGMDAGTGGQASKKARTYQKDGRGRGRPSTGFGNQRNSYSSSAYRTQRTSYAPSYATPAVSYAAHAYAGPSGSYHRRSDMAPHAGFIPAAQQVRNPYDYQLQRPGAYDSQLRGNSGYAGASLYGAPYTEYSSYAGYQAGHTYPSRGAYGYRGPYY